MEKRTAVHRESIHPVYANGSEAYDSPPLNQLLHNYLVKQVNLAPGLMVTEASSLRLVVEEMQKSKTGCAVIASKGKITGIFTERDLLKKVIGEKIDWNEPIFKFATREPVTMNVNEPLRKALFLMRKKNFRHIPILGEAGELLGVLSVRNVIRLFAEHFPQEVLNLPPRPSASAPETPEGG